jgi:hypothetical protein
MREDQSRYIQLIALAAEWAQSSGMPINMVLRRLCEWAVAGAFPEGTFVTSGGEKIAPLDLLIAVRVVIGNGQAPFGDETINTDVDVARDRVTSALLTGHDILEFCERTETLPPPSMLGGLRRLLAGRDRRKHVAPPECPAADEHAARQWAYRNAVGGLNALRSNSTRLKGEHMGPGPRRTENDPVSFEYWGPKWMKMRDDVQADILRCGDNELQQKLSALEAEWKEFVDGNSAKAEADAEPQRGSVNTVAFTETLPANATIVAGEPTITEPRLRISKTLRRAHLDGHKLTLYPRQFKLLLMLAETAMKSEGPALKIALESHLFAGRFDDKALGQAVHKLKTQMIESGLAADVGQSIIENVRATGYRLLLPASDIQIEA